jgi:hypothetical protein
MGHHPKMCRYDISQKEALMFSQNILQGFVTGSF